MYIHHVILLLQNETRPPCWGLFCDNNQQGVLYLLHIDLAVSARTVILVHPYSLVSFNQIWLICLYLGWSFVFCVRDRIKLELSKLRNSILYKLNMIWNVSSYVTNRVLFFLSWLSGGSGQGTIFEFFEFCSWDCLPVCDFRFNNPL